MISVKNIFHCLSGNSDITEEFIYNHTAIQSVKKYEVLSSSTDESYNMGYIPLCKNNKNKNINVFENKQGILISRNGKAGTMRYLPKGYYTINDHAYILYLKDSFVKQYNMNEHIEELFLKYFIFTYNVDVKSFSTNNDNATWNKKSFFDTFEIENISMIKLNEFSKVLQDINKTSNILNELYNKITNLERKTIILNQFENCKLEPIKNIFDYCSRNDMLSEEGIYNHRPIDSNISVLSGSSQNIHYGNIDRNVEGIHFVENKQCLHLISRGNAGKLTYIPKGDYATNTNAFLLYFKDSYKKVNKIESDIEEEILLKYFQIYLQPIFFEISSHADLGVFPLTNVMKSLEIPSFKLTNTMKLEIDTLNQYNDLKDNIYTLYNKFNTLLSKQFI